MRARAPIWFALILGVLGIFWVLRTFTSPETPQTTYYPLTDFGRSTHGVYAFTNLLLLAIFIAIEGWLVYALFRFRRRGASDAGAEDALPPQTHGHTPGEIGFTTATTLLVIVLYIPSCQQIAYTQGAVPDGAMTIEVTGRQWWWEIYYPDYDLVVANELRIPTGRPVNLQLTSSDVIHAFWVPRLGGKRDLVPGRTQTIWFTPEEEGVYDGQCAEFCGTSHANMSFQTVVASPADFDAWVAQQKSPPAAAPDALAQQGQVAFLTAGGCITCHTTFMNDKSVLGMQGPNLTKLATRKMIGAGLLPNDRQNLFRWIKNPHAIKPGVLMNVANPSTLQCKAAGDPDPCCNGEGTGNCLGDDVIEQLVAYLESRG